MVLLIILLITEILTIVVLQQHYRNYSTPKYFISIFIHVILSLPVWVSFIATHYYKGFYDSPRHIWLMMNLTGLVTAIVFPRIILIILHFTGKAVKLKSHGHLRWVTNAGMLIMTAIILIIATSTLYGRFNFTTEEVTINIKDLNNDLDGLKIVQLSDMHLSSFYHHKKQLEKVMDKVNQLHPDLLINTGDFITFGWREFELDDTILVKAKSKYGSFAILGNHDVGTYDPEYSEEDRKDNIQKMIALIRKSGYTVLYDESSIVNIGKARIGMIGVSTGGRHPKVTHGNLDKAVAGLDSVDLKILLTHDPNHWAEAVDKKTDIDLTLSGHTHGMQMGIITKHFRWSPSKYFYPHWNGLYQDGKQYHYVNRGLGTNAIPFRIWMPPEITVITLKKL
jgi:hypothetical protein